MNLSQHAPGTQPGQSEDAGAIERRAEQRLSQNDFLRTLFTLLDEHQIRYCVLHSWEGLPDQLPGDLDLAVHPDERASLPLVFQELHNKGYQLVQCLNYFAQAYYLVFAWFAGDTPKLAAVDLIFEHRRSGLISLSGEELIANRERFGEFWVASPATEFVYLLAKKAWKGSVPPGQARRLKLLVEKLGRAQAEKLAGKVFMGKLKAEVVEACASGSIEKLLGTLGAQLWWTSFRRHPLGLARFLFAEALRVMRRCLQPTGLFLVVLGPDGVGKSTLVSQLTQSCRRCFRRQRIFHWRPMVILRRKERGAPLTDPYAEPARGTLASVAALLVVFLDYWLAYLLVLQPFLVRSGLIVFDRYFADLLVDPLRYRYGGPMWLPKFLSRFFPRPELLFLVLDAEDKVILSRKREVVLEELRRQRVGYRQFTEQEGKGRLIKADQGIERMVGEASRFVVEHLARRIERRNSGWLAARGGAVRPAEAGLGQLVPVNDLLHSAIHQLVGLGELRAAPSGNDLQGGDPPASVVVSSNPTKRTRHELARQGYTRVRWFFVLPSPTSPRWLFPLGNGCGALEGLEVYKPYATGARVWKSLLTLVVAARCQSLVPHKVLVASRGSLPLEALVREVTGEAETVFALSLGTPNRFRKLTIQVMRPEGEILGYIKLPLTEAATERVRHEAEMLRRLGNFAALRGHIPKVLHAGDWKNGYILFQSCGPSCPGPIQFNNLHEDFLRKLGGLHQVLKPGEALVKEVAARWQKAGPSLDPAWRALGQAALKKAAHELDGAMIPCGIMHGDFAPWNTRVERGRLYAFDWESAAWDAPILWDPFHFHVQVASLLNKNGRRVLSLSRFSGERASFLLYLLASVCQLVEEKAPLGHTGLRYRQRLLDKELSGI
jgi:thymidylate kinase